MDASYRLASQIAFAFLLAALIPAVQAQTWTPVALPAPPDEGIAECRPSPGIYSGLFGTSRGLVLGSPCGTHLLAEGDQWQRLSPNAGVDLTTDQAGRLYARWLIGAEHDSAGPFRLDEESGAWRSFREGLPPLDAPSEPYLLFFAVDGDDVAWSVMGFGDYEANLPALYRRPVGEPAWTRVPDAAHPIGFPPIWLHRLRTGEVVGTSLRTDEADPETWRVHLRRQQQDGTWPAIDAGQVPADASWLPLVGLSSDGDEVLLVQGAPGLSGPGQPGPGFAVACAGTACAPRTSPTGTMFSGLVDAGDALVVGKMMGDGPALQLTLDAGRSWQPVDMPSAETSVWNLALDGPSRLFVHTMFDDRLWATPLAALPTAADPDPAASEHLLHVSLAPNPFQSEATVRVSGALGERVAVRVFDVLGRTVAELYQGRLADAETELSMPRLAPGLYVVQVKGDSSVQTVRAVVQR